MSTSAITQQGILGIGPGIGAGMWTRVGRADVAVTSPSADNGILHTFSSLDGNSDVRYAIIMRFNYVSNAGGTYFIVNNDTGNNYPVIWLSGGGNGSTGAGSTGVNGSLPGSGPRGTTVTNFATAILDAATGGLRNYRIESQEPSSSAGFGSGFYETVCSFWNNTTDNIISFDWRCSKANCIGAGSYVELWKLGPPPSTQGSSSGGGLTWSIITGGTTATSGNGYFIDATSAPVTLLLPSTVALNMQVGVRVINAANTITIGANGNRIESSTSGLLMNVPDAAVTLVYCNNTKGWLMTGLK